MDIQFMNNESVVHNPRQASGGILTITSPKTDQYNAGSHKNQHRVLQTNGEDELPRFLAAMNEMWEQFPKRCSSTQACKPLFRYSDGSVIRRDRVWRLLTLAANAVNCDSDVSVGSQSLRLGRATAMYHQTNNLKRTRRFGRWASAVHSYLWEGREHSRCLASEMTNDTMRILRKADSTQEAAAQQQRRQSGNINMAAAAAQQQLEDPTGSICVEGEGGKSMKRRRSPYVT